ncbi:MAG: DegV family protein [Clostridia bacterium]|nr:DegV family protein [Clostridia bacterium]
MSVSVKITADSTCDLGPVLTEKYNVSIMPLTVLLGEEVYHDGVDITPQMIFDYVATNNVLPKTSAPSVEDYTKFFAEHLEEYDHVIHFNISSKASASNSNALQAAGAFKGKVSVIDTWALSTGQGLLALKACDLAAAGEKPKRIVEAVTALIPKVNTSFIPDRLDYLHKGGRCSLAALLGAKVLRLHPMISMKEGQLYAKKKYMGNLDASIRKYIDDLVEEYPSYDRTRCFITHSSAEPETVRKARELVESKFDFQEVIETVAGCVVTSHCGKNTLGVLFIAE